MEGARNAAFGRKSQLLVAFPNEGPAGSRAKEWTSRTKIRLYMDQLINSVPPGSSGATAPNKHICSHRQLARPKHNANTLRSCQNPHAEAFGPSPPACLQSVWHGRRALKARAETGGELFVKSAESVFATQDYPSRCAETPQQK